MGKPRPGCPGSHRSWWSRELGIFLANPLSCYRSLSGPSGPKCPRSVPENKGFPRECPTGCLRGLSRPGSGVPKKCPESVPGVSKRCPGHSWETLGTLFGHSRARGPTSPGDTPSDTPSNTDTLGDTSGLLQGVQGLHATNSSKHPIFARPIREQTPIWEDLRFPLPLQFPLPKPQSPKMKIKLAQE